MQYKENNRSKFDKFLAGKGFYAVLAICVLTVALATYFTVAKLSVSEKPKNTSYFNSQSFITNSQNLITSKPAQNNTQSEPYSSNNTTSKIETVEENGTVNYFVLPVTGEILKDYSDTALQFSSTYNDMRLHLGVDIASPEGTVVKCAGDGTVLSVNETADFGTVVTIDHGNKVKAKYCGLKNITVKEGEILSVGQALGEIGIIPCECVDKPHLHFEVFRDDKSIPPMQIIEEFLK